MRWIKFSSLLLLLSLSVWSATQTAPLTLAQVLTGLQTQGTTPETRTITARNRYIARRIRERGVTFRLTAEFESELRNAGASPELLKAIRENSPPALTPTPTAPNPTIIPMPKPAVPDRVVLPNSYSENLKGVLLEMIEIPAGKFTMGGDKYDDEKPPHQVSVPSFYAGKYEVTQKQWKAVMGNNPSSFKGNDLPVESVSWHEAQAFCAKLQEITGKAYRLPSEAEWEYACRARTTGDYAGNLDAMAWYDKNSGSKTHPVGQKQKNAFGLFDMHGNVWEWCEDVWHENYNGALNDGSAWRAGGTQGRRVVRGGSWSHSVSLCRSADRGNIAPDGRYSNFGVRVVVAARTQ